MHSIATTAPSSQRGLADIMPTAVFATRRALPLMALRILANALFIVGLLALNKLGDFGAGVFFSVLAIMVVVSPEAAFKALAICYLGLMINTFFVPKSLVWTPGRVVIPFLALARFGVDLAAYRLSLRNPVSYGSLLVFGAVMAVCSTASGWYMHIALLKIIYFLVFVTMIFMATTVLRHRRADIGEWFLSLILAAALFGIGAVAINVDNNFRPFRVDTYGKGVGTMFNGAFSHPNIHAVYGALFVAFLGSVWLLSTYRQRWLVLPILACWIVFIVWSASRTAVGASVSAMALLVFYAKPLRSRFGWRLRPNLRRRTLVGILMLAVIAGLFWDATTERSLQKALSSYIVKGTVSDVDFDKQVSVERILFSRQGLIEFSWNNFLENPVFGIGFGVAKTEAFERMATYLTAPAEKGFLPTAILEEGGLLGTAAFLLFVALFSRDLSRESNIPGLITFWVFLVTNLGEVTIFAPGGAGSFGWITVAASMILCDHCWTPPVPRGDRFANQYARSA